MRMFAWAILTVQNLCSEHAAPVRIGWKLADRIFYGNGTLSKGNKFAQLVLGTPANRVVPVMREFESQKTSVALPPNKVCKPFDNTETVERLVTTKPP